MDDTGESGGDMTLRTEIRALIAESLLGLACKIYPPIYGWLDLEAMANDLRRMERELRRRGKIW